jgi:hypothetical protein
LWVEPTEFEVIRKDVPACYTFFGGRLTKRQKATRRGDVWPELWEVMSKKERKIAVEEWKSERPESTKRE